MADGRIRLRWILAEIAQLVEHSPEEGRVPSSNLGLGTKTETAPTFVGAVFLATYYELLTRSYL